MSMLSCKGHLDLKENKIQNTSNENSSGIINGIVCDLHQGLYGVIRVVLGYFSLTDEQALRLRHIRELQAKDDHLLLDIGLTRDGIETAMAISRRAPAVLPLDGATRIPR
ncbi:hypothetical protein [Pararhizobium gei]|uniref:hypothetical protein n=1 Tax=Pararhizobium gei TaxID=1395951 RepID=UPI0023DB76B5|nr:hypothetical protein [Rhizobium gei]